MPTCSLTSGAAGAPGAVTPHAPAGPVLVKETLKAYKMNDTVGFITAYKDSHTHAVRQANQTMAIHVYQVGEFYFPCNWDNPNYCEEVAAMEEKPLEVAGRHHFSASWTK